MKRRWLPLLLILLLLCQAKATATTLPRVTKYRQEFQDIHEKDWYYGYVADLYAFGLTNGKGNSDTFAPNDSLTVAETITMAARVRSLYQYGDTETGAAAFSGDSWYAPYVSYLQSLSLLGQEFEGQYHLPATRCQVAHILSMAAPELPVINGDTVDACYGTYIPDVTESTPYQSEILQLYRCGILNGTDAAGRFLPEDLVTRRQIAAIVVRLVDSEQRILLDWQLPTKTVTYASLVTSDGIFYASPSANDTAAIDADVRYMLSRGERTLSLQYTKIPDRTSLQLLLDNFLTAICNYPEQGYNQVSCSYSTNGSVTLTFSSSLENGTQFELHRQAALEQALAVQASLWENGLITESSTEMEIAWAYCHWLCEHCTYAADYTTDGIEHSSYGALCLGEAVCDGYTAAYNLLLRLEGISCASAIKGNHMWTTAVLDGTLCHIDVTWADQSWGIHQGYFAMTEEEAMSRSIA